MVFRALINAIKSYRAQTRALEHIRAERAAIQRTVDEIEAMQRTNRAAEAELSAFVKFSKEEVEANSAALEEADRVSTELTNRLGELGEAQLRDVYAAEHAMADADGGSSAERVKEIMERIARGQEPVGGGGGVGSGDGEGKKTS